MKIIRQSKTDYTKKELKRIHANKCCNICPKCGESNSYLFYIQNGQEKGVDKYAIAEHHKLFSCYYTDSYKCYTCGCEWESDPW